MKNLKLIGKVTLFVSILMIAIGIIVQDSNTLNSLMNISGIKNKSSNSNTKIIREQVQKEEKKENVFLRKIEIETAPAAIIVPPRVEVYEGMTMEELAAKLDRHLGKDIVAGKGIVIATESLNRGVDPIVATAILLHETGCGSKCSNLARYCNNFGGQKGSPSCNGGSFKRYNSIDEGIAGYISNLSRNYYAIGLNTVEKIAPKYCEGNTWAGYINYFVRKIRAN